MPYGLWKDVDWPQAASVEAWETTVSFDRKIDWEPSWGLDKIETEPSLLLSQLADIRESKREERSKRHVPSIHDSLPRRPKSSAATYAISRGICDKHGYEKKTKNKLVQETEGDAGAKLRQTEQAVKTWSMKGKAAKIPESTMRYALPDNMMAVSNRREPGERKLHDARDSIIPVSYEDTVTRLSSEAEAKENDAERVERAQLSVYLAAQELAESNVSLSAVKDLLARFQNSESAVFTKEYVLTQHLYGTMCDLLRDLWVTTVNLSQELEFDSLALLDENTKANMRNISPQSNQETLLSSWLQMVLDTLNSLQWDSVRSDFQKWVKTAQEQDALLRDALDYIGEHMDSVLNLLTISRYAIEEALGKHILIAANQLMEFHENMTTWTDHPDRPEHTMRSLQRNGSSGSSMDLRLHQLLEIAQQEKEHQRRILELNQGLRHKHYEKVDLDHEAKLACPLPQVAKKNKTIIVNAHGSALLQSSITSEEVKKKSKMSVKDLPPNPLDHVSEILARCMEQGRAAVETIEKSKRERDKLLRSAKNLYIKKKKEERLLALRMRYQVDEVMDSHPYLESRRPSMHVRFSDQPTIQLQDATGNLQPMIQQHDTTGSLQPGIQQHDTTESLSDNQAHWNSSESYRMLMSEGFGDDVHKFRQIEYERLLQKKQDLFNKLNHFSVKVTLAEVWQPSLKLHAVEDKSTMQKVTGTDLTRSLHSDMPPSAKRESATPSAASSEHPSRCGSKEAHTAEVDGQVSIEDILEVCAGLEAQGNETRKQLEELCKSHWNIRRRVVRRFGADLWDYIPEHDEEGPDVWFKSNPRKRVMSIVSDGVAKLLAKGARLLGREGEQQLKAFAADLKGIGQSMEQERQERLQSAQGFLNDHHAAWHFRVDVPFDMLLRRFSSTWKGLQDRVRPEIDTKIDSDINVEELSNDGSLVGSLKEASESSEGNSSHVGTGHVPQAAETNKFVPIGASARSLQATILKMQTESTSMKDTTQQLQAESEKLEKQIETLKKVMLRQIEIAAARARSHEAKTQIKDLVREIEHVKQTVIRVKKFGWQDPDSSRLSTLSSSARNPRGSSSQRSDEDDNRLSSLSRFDEQAGRSLVAEQSRSTRKGIFDMTPVTKKLSPERMEKKMLMNRDLYRSKIEKVAQAEKVLKMRAGRKKEELRRLMVVLTKLGYGNFDTEVLKTKEEMKEQWDKEIANVRSQLLTANKVLKHWRSRTDQRYEDIRLQYGDEVLQYIKDSAKRKTKDGKLALYNAVRRSSLEALPEVAASPPSSRSSTHRDATGTTSFNEAFDPLGGLDLDKMSQAYCSKAAMIRKIDRAIQRLADLEKERTGRLGDGLPDYSAERQRLLVLQSFFHGKQTSAGKSQVATLGGGLNASSNSKGRIFRSALGATDVHAGLAGNELGMPGDTALVGTAVKSRRARRLLREPIGSRSKPNSGELGLGIVGNRGTTEMTKDSDEDSDDDELFKNARGSLSSLYESLQKKVSKPSVTLDGLNKRWRAEQRGSQDARDKRQTVTFADTIELLNTRNKQLALLHEHHEPNEPLPCNERVQMLRLFIDDSSDVVSNTKVKKLRFQERSEEIRPSKKKRLVFHAKSNPGKRSKDTSKAMLGLLDFKTPKHMTRRKTWKLNHDVGQEVEDTTLAVALSDLAVKAERCELCLQRKKAVINRLTKDLIDAARDSIHSSKYSSMNTSQSLVDDETNPWQEAARSQQGLQLLRACRERLLQEFGSFEKAFESATCLPGEQSDEFMYFDAFDWLAGVVGFDETERRFMFDHVALALGLEKGCEKFEKAPFADVLRSAVPLSNLVHLRIRLLRRFGRASLAFDSSADRGSYLSPSAFCKMLETVNGDASEARQLFGQIEMHNECPPDKRSHRKVTRRAVLKSLRFAEHLAAARKLCQHLHTVHRWRNNANDEDLLHIVGGGLEPSAEMPLAPEDGNMEQLVTAYHTLVQISDIRYINKRLNLEQLQAAVKSISLSREDVRWLFRLCSRKSKDGLVTIQEVAMRALGGLGQRCKVLALRVGQEAATRGCHRCKAFTAIAVKSALGELAPRRVSLGVGQLSQSDEEFSIRHVRESSRRKAGAVPRYNFKIARSRRFKAAPSELGDLDSGVEASVEDTTSDVEDLWSADESVSRRGSRETVSRRDSRQKEPLVPTPERRAHNGRTSGSRSSSPIAIPIMRRDRPGAEMEPIGAAKRHWSWWLDYGIRSRSKKLRPREVVHRSRRPWSRSVVPPPPRCLGISHTASLDRAESVIIAGCSEQEGETEVLNQVPSTLESIEPKDEVDSQHRDQSDSEGHRLSGSGSEGRLSPLGRSNNVAFESDNKAGSDVFDSQKNSAERTTGRRPSRGAKPMPKRARTRTSIATISSITSPPRRRDSRISCWSRDDRSIRRGDTLEVTSKEIDSKDPVEDESTKWRFKEQQERRGFTRRQGSAEQQVNEEIHGSEGSESEAKSDVNSDSKDSRSPTPTSASRRMCDSLEVKRPQIRSALFGGDAIELQVATQRTQDFRCRLLTRFRTPAKAFEVLAGAKSTNLDVESLQTKVEKLLSFNPLDARRIVTVLAGVEEVREIAYVNFLRLMRFSMPVNSVLEFRTRLVQMFDSVEIAFREIGFLGNEYDIGTFEKPMLSAGIVSGDARRIFRVVDAVNPGGACGHLMASDFQRALDNAHILAWLEAFYARVVVGAKGLSIFDVLLEGESAIEATRLPDADSLEKALGQAYPSEFVRETFALLEKICAPNEVTLGAFAHILHNAFGSAGARKRSKERAKMQKQRTQPLVGRSGTQAKVKSRPLIHMMTLGNLSMDASTSQASPEPQTPISEGERLASATAAADAVPNKHHVVREESLVNTRRLRRQVMFSFADYGEAYDVFKKKRPQEGVALDEWMEAMPFFGFSNANAWELVFGHMVQWQHPRWDPRCTEGRVNIAVLARSLDEAAPCLTPLALRELLQAKYGTLQKAWVQLAGKESVEELSLASWKRALQQVGVMGDDAGYLHALLRAAPIAERSSDVRYPNVSRVAFMATMRGAESLTRLFDLLECLQNEHGPVSCAFEANSYTKAPLPIGTFEEELAVLLHTTVEETRTLFAYLDFHQDGLVCIDDLLDALTLMQATFLPSRRAKEETLAELPKPSDWQDDESLGDLASRSRSAMSPSEIEATGRASSELTIATISPMDLKVPLRAKGGSAASGSYSIHRISTALPDSDSESADGDVRVRQQRPWTSMAFTGDGTQKHSGVTFGAVGLQSKLPQEEVQFLPHLDLAASRKRSIESHEDSRLAPRPSSLRRFTNLSEWTPRSIPPAELGSRTSEMPAVGFGLPGSASLAESASPQKPGSSLPSAGLRASTSPEIGFGVADLPHQRAHQAELPTLAGVMAVQPVASLSQTQPKATKRATTLGMKANVPSSGGFRKSMSGQRS